MNMKKTFWFVLSVVTLVRLVIIANIGLGDDEVYHWVWSKHLALSYYDHPPMVTYIIWFLTSIFGDTAFLIHLGALLCVTAFTIVIYVWAKEMFSSEEAAWGALLIIFVPIFFVGGVIIAPDSPLGLFWVLALWLIWRALKYQKSVYWYLGGISVGLGTLSKYNALILPLLFFLYLIFSKKHRFWLCKKEPYLAVILSMVIFLPVIVWNAQNEWASFYFQFMGRHQGFFSITRFFSFLGSQMIYISPIAFIMAIIGFYKLAKGGFMVSYHADMVSYHADKDKQWHLRYLFLTSFPLIVLFSLNSFFSSSFKPHWPAFGYIGGLLGIAIGLPISKKRKNIFKVNFLVCGLLVGIVITQTFYPFLPIPPDQDFTNDLYGWEELSQDIKILRKELSADISLVAERYQTGSPLSFAAKEDVFVLHPTRITAFKFWQDEKDLINKDVLYFTHSRYFTPPEEIYQFSELKWVKKIPIYRNHKLIRTFYIYYLVGFAGVKRNHE